MRRAIVIAVVVATFALGACRREMPDYGPMKLGGTTAALAYTNQQQSVVPIPTAPIQQ